MERIFRDHPRSDSESIRPLILIESDHLFRRYPTSNRTDRNAGRIPSESRVGLSGYRRRQLDRPMAKEMYLPKFVVRKVPAEKSESYDTTTDDISQFAHDDSKVADDDSRPRDDKSNLSGGNSCVRDGESTLSEVLSLHTNDFLRWRKCVRP